jgi:hypothetical protein
MKVRGIYRTYPTCGYQLITARIQERCEQRANRQHCPVCRAGS